MTRAVEDADAEVYLRKPVKPGLPILQGSPWNWFGVADKDYVVGSINILLLGRFMGIANLAKT
jgi:hypothetical protein